MIYWARRIATSLITGTTMLACLPAASGAAQTPPPSIEVASTPGTTVTTATLGTNLACVPQDPASGLTYSWTGHGPTTTMSHHMVVPADTGPLGAILSCTVTIPGKDESVPASVYVLPVLTAPSVQGTLSKGRVLTCDPGTNFGSFTYTWSFDGDDDVAQGATYTPSVAGKDVSCTIKQGNDSKESPTVTLLAALGKPAVTFSGGLAVGTSLTCVPAAGPARPALAYQWLVGGQAVTGATGSAYTVSPNDAEKSVTCRVIDATDNNTSDPMAIPKATTPPVQTVTTTTTLPTTTVTVTGPTTTTTQTVTVTTPVPVALGAPSFVLKTVVGISPKHRRIEITGRASNVARCGGRLKVQFKGPGDKRWYDSIKPAVLAPLPGGTVDDHECAFKADLNTFTSRYVNALLKYAKKHPHGANIAVRVMDGTTSTSKTATTSAK